MDDLTKVGFVPTKRQYASKKPINRTNKFIKVTHCVDHTGFKENCSNCLLLLVYVLAVRLEMLEEQLSRDPFEKSRHPQRRRK